MALSKRCMQLHSEILSIHSNGHNCLYNAIKKYASIGQFSKCLFSKKQTSSLANPSLPGLEPGASGLEVQRAIPLRHRDCANKYDSGTV